MSETLVVYLVRASVLFLAACLVALVVSVWRKNRMKSFLFKDLLIGEDQWKKAFNTVGLDFVSAPSVPLFEILYSSFKYGDQTNGYRLLKLNQKFDDYHQVVKWLKAHSLSPKIGMRRRFIIEQIISNRLSRTAQEGGDSKLKLSGNSFLNLVKDDEPLNVSASAPPVGAVGEFTDYVPIASIVYSALKSGGQVIKGQKKARSAASDLILDSASRSLASFGGAKFGFLVGSTLAPFTGGTSAIIIPAATTAIGSILGNFGGKGLFRFIKDRPVRKATALLMQRGRQYLLLFEEKLPDMIALACLPYEEKRLQARQSYREGQGRLMGLFFPRLSTMLLKLVEKSLIQDQNAVKKFYRHILSKAKKAGRRKGGLLLFGQGTEILLSDVTLLSAYNEVRESLKYLEEVRKKAA